MLITLQSSIEENDDYKSGTSWISGTLPSRRVIVQGRIIVLKWMGGWMDGWMDG